MTVGFSVQWSRALLNVGYSRKNRQIITQTEASLRPVNGAVQVAERREQGGQLHCAVDPCSVHTTEQCTKSALSTGRAFTALH